MITTLILTVIGILAIVLIFFTIPLLAKQPKNLWMLIPSILLGLVFAYISADELESNFTAYILVFPLVMLMVLALLYNMVPNSSSRE
ncbi:MAG: hypothetical protein GY810_03690 [Aureispira sp.]|nr:hypothetical protein [Aureispira sp.]